MKYLDLFAALTLIACQKDETISGQTLPSDTWVLAQMKGETITTPITLTFPEKGKIAGQAPCNRYFAAQNAPLPWFEVGAIGATKRACPKLKLETTYFQTLTKMTLIERTGDTLLLSSDGTETLEFIRTP